MSSVSTRSLSLWRALVDILCNDLFLMTNFFRFGLLSLVLPQSQCRVLLTRNRKQSTAADFFKVFSDLSILLKVKLVVYSDI